MGKSRNVKEDTRMRIAKSSGFNMTFDLDMYLGIPLNYKKVTKYTFQNMIKKI